MYTNTKDVLYFLKLNQNTNTDHKTDFCICVSRYPLLSTWELLVDSQPITNCKNRQT